MLCLPSSGPLPVATIGVWLRRWLISSLSVSTHCSRHKLHGIYDWDTLLRAGTKIVGLWFGAIWPGLYHIRSVHQACPIAKCFDECGLDHLHSPPHSEDQSLYYPIKNGHSTSQFYFSFLNAGSPTQGPYILGRYSTTELYHTPYPTLLFVFESLMYSRLA